MCDEYEWVGVEQLGRSLSYPDVVRYRGETAPWVVQFLNEQGLAQLCGVDGAPGAEVTVRRVSLVSLLEVRRPRRLEQEERDRVMTATIRSAAEFVRDLRIKGDTSGEGVKLRNQIAKLIEEQADV